MLIEHETAPSIALKIMESGLFRGGPILGDAGLNAVPPGGVGYFADQAEWNGAIMTFEWSGPCAGRCPEEPLADILYDEKPHRLFIPVGTKNYLLLKDISLMRGYSWDECITEYPFPFALDLFNFKHWGRAIRSRTAAGKRAQLDAIEAKVAALKINPKPISIGAYVERRWG